MVLTQKMQNKRATRLNLVALLFIAYFRVHMCEFIIFDTAV